MAILDKSGHEIAHDGGKSNRIQWSVGGNQGGVKIVLRNKHKEVKAASVKAETN